MREALEVALSREGYEVRAQATGQNLSETLQRFRPDLAILDIRLPSGPDGLSLARRIRVESDVPILFLTAAGELDERLAGFNAGGDDYLVKPFSMAELLVRVRALLRRAGRLISASWNLADLVVDEAARMVTRGDTSVELTPTEFDLLCALARNRGQVVPKRRLLTMVWGFDSYDPNLVQVHVSSLRRKLEEHGPRIIHTVHGVGYVLRV